VACDLARWYPSLRQHLAKGMEGHISSDIDRLFKLLIETPLSTLGHDILHKRLPVIVVDALDECGGLRYDSMGRKDYEALLHTLQRYTQEEDLKKFKLIITSRPDDRITQTFPDSISTHVNRSLTHLTEIKRYTHQRGNCVLAWEPKSNESVAKGMFNPSR